MIVAITVVLIVAMICGTFLFTCYMEHIHTEVRAYTLDSVECIVKEIRQHIKYIEEQLKENK